MVIPTFCYQLHFPKSKTIRFRFILNKVFQLLVLTLICIFLLVEYTLPVLYQSKKYFRDEEHGILEKYFYVI